MNARATATMPDPTPAAPAAPAAGAASPAAARTGWFPVLLTAAYAAAVFATVLAHEPWRDEAQAWLIAAAHADLSDVFAHLRTEGHPIAWYACLWAIARAWPDPLAMQLFHAAVATASAAVIAFRAPLPAWQRALLVFSYYFAYEYAAVARGYALGVLFVLLACALIGRRRERLVWVAVLLAAAANTSIHGSIVAVAVAMGLAVDFAWERWHGRPTAPLRSAVAAGLIVAAGVALCYAQVRRYPTGTGGFPAAADVGAVADGGRVAAALNGLRVGLLPLPGSLEHFRDSSPFAHLSPAAKTTAGLLSAALVVIPLLAATRRPAAFAIAACGAAALVGFAAITFRGYSRHHGHAFVLFVVVLWTWRSFAAHPWPIARLERLWRTARPGGVRVATAALAAVLGWHAAFGAFALASDLLRPFTGSRYAAALVRDHFPPDALVVGSRDLNVSAVAAELGRPIYYVESGEFGGPIDWSRRKSRRNSPHPLAAIRSLLPAGGTGALVTNYPIESDGAVSVELIGVAPPTIVLDERHRVYRFTYVPEVR